MGGGRGGNFGNTFGKTLDTISNILTAASFIPGVDTFTNIVAIPVDLLRGDFVSAGLDALGAIPFAGEIADAAKAVKTADSIADAAKAVKTADNIIDTAKAVDKAVDAAKIAGANSKGNKLLSKVSNSKLKNTIKEMYRPGAKVGDGGLADAIRHEIKTGELVGGKSHIQKGRERLNNLERILKREALTKQEKKIVEDLIEDLKSALGGK